MGHGSLAVKKDTAYTITEPRPLFPPSPGELYNKKNGYSGRFRREKEGNSRDNPFPD